jgi:Fe-S cluster assembly protein SufD
VSHEALQAEPAAAADAAARGVAAWAEPWAALVAERSRTRGREPERLEALRAAAFARFQELGFPTTRQEDWRFTNVGPLARTRFATAPARQPDAAQLAPWLFPVATSADGASGEAARLVLVDGVVAPQLSVLTGLPAGVRFGSLAVAIGSNDPAVEELGRRASFDEQAFVALNTALFRDGALLVVPRGVVLEQPLQVIFVSTGATAEEGQAATATVSFPRLLVYAGERSAFTLVERYVTLGPPGAAPGAEPGEAFTCPVTEIFAGPSSVVDHYRLAQESATTWHVGLQQLWCERNAALTSYSIVTGGGLVRQDVRAVLAGEGVDAVLNGLYLTRGRQHVDHHMYVEHRQPHCNSHELYKGILEGRSRAVFNGLIHVWPGAQKTDAKQTNRNLLLSGEALVNTNPQLRIFADDVKCTHGSTVGQLDEEAVFYLRSRGIGAEAAKSLLTYAFARDVVDRIKAAPVRHELEELLLARLPRGEVVRQAL